MKEKEEIDQLFRDQLLGREVEMDPLAAEKAMELLIAEDIAISSKRRRRIALLLTICSAIVASIFLFFPKQTETVETISTTIENANGTLKETNPPAQNLSSTNENTSSIKPNDSSFVPQSSEEKVMIADEKSEKHHDANATSVKIENRDIIEPHKSITQTIHESIAEDENPLLASEIEIKECETESAELENGIVNTDNTSKEDTVSLSKTLAVENTLSIPEITLDVQTINSTASDQLNTPPHVSILENDTSTIELPKAVFQKDTLLSNLENLSPPQIDSEVLPSQNKNQFFIGMSLLRNHGLLQSNQEELNDYVDQRNEQESDIMSLGFDAGLARSFGRSSILYGIGYYQSGEKINYSGYSTTQEYDTTDSWNYRTYVLQIVDASPSGGSINFDTTFVIAHSDSTLIQTIDSTTFTSSNSKISANNGISKIHHITIPISYRYNLIQKNNFILGIGVGFEADLRAGASASYLLADRQNIESLNSFDGYRKMMINGAASLELQYRPALSNLSLSLGGGLKRNLYSWNKDFDHIYSMPFVRFSVGYFFK